MDQPSKIKITFFPPGFVFMIPNYRELQNSVSEKDDVWSSDLKLVKHLDKHISNFCWELKPN